MICLLGILSPFNLESGSASLVQGLQCQNVRVGTRQMGEVVQAPSATAAGDDANDPIVQYIVLRRDLWSEQGWPLGPLIAQACHASVAALWLAKDDPESQQYVSDAEIDSMHKVKYGTLTLHSKMLCQQFQDIACDGS